MNMLDALIRPLSPSWALRRTQARQLLAAYDAATPTRTRRNPKDNASGNALTAKAGETLRGQARYLEQNHDLCRGILQTMVSNIVGPKGIGIEPQVFNKSGEIDKEFSKQIQKLLKNWARKPETTQQMSWAKTQRMVARSWLRDGECLSKAVIGNIQTLRHGTTVPFSIELLEADFISEISDDKNVIQGIETNGWGQPIFYHLYDQYPSDKFIYSMKTRKVSAGVIDHIKFADRFKQVRGVSIFAAVLSRLNDLKDYEESERIAAKIAANMAAYIKKGSPDSYIKSDDDEDDRDFSMGAGMIWDNLLPGEDVGTIQSNRPSAQLEPFRNAMLKAIASGTGAGYSSISKTYDGTYSAQRQELVEQWIVYATLSDEFIQQFVEPTYIRFVKTAISSGVLAVPDNIDQDTLFDADYLTPSMPWIDPKKEADGHEKQLQLKITSPQKIIRQKGDNPNEILDQWQKWDEALDERGLKIEEVDPPPNNQPNTEPA
jgi:lambda family phage portal protein